MSKFFKVISDSILILTIIVLSLYFVLRIADVIRIYNVETGSMEDKIHAGDYILLFKKSNYNIGDVVTYKEKEYFITHRIVKIENDLITTKGDANNLEDAVINKNQIEGKAVYWGGILNFVINYKFVIIAFLIGVYLISCYFDDNKEKDGKKNEKKKQTIDIENVEIEKEVINDVKEEKHEEKTIIDEEEKKIEIIDKPDIKPNENTTEKVQGKKEIKKRTTKKAQTKKKPTKSTTSKTKPKGNKTKVNKKTTKSTTGKTKNNKKTTKSTTAKKNNKAQSK